MSAQFASRRMWPWMVCVVGLVGWVAFLLVTFRAPFMEVWRWTTTATALAGLAFFVTNWVVTRGACWRSQIGWNFQMMAAALTAAFGMIAFRVWTGTTVDPRVWLWVSVTLFVVLVWRTALAIVTNQHGRPRRRPDIGGV